MESLPDMANSQQKLSQAEMEDFLDHHPYAWTLPLAWYDFQPKLQEVEKMETQQVVKERVRKDSTDGQWNEFHTASELANKERGPPSEKQKQYIFALGKAVGMKIEVSKIADREQASRLIERLKLLNQQMNGNRGNGFDAWLRDKRVAFGLATKLLFRRYCEQQKDPVKWKRFWKDVHKFYTAYQRQQEIAVSSSGGEAL